MGLDETATFDIATRMIEEASSIAISGHTDPDGDALGSVLGMYWAIRQKWPEKKVVPLLANDRPVPGSYRFLPGSEQFVTAASFDESVDLFISLDTPTIERLDDSGAVMARSPKTLSFDHHPQRSPFAEVSLVRTEAASCGDIVYDFVTYSGIQLDPALAMCLLTAVVTDTGRFQYQNVDAHSLEMAADLVKSGADISEICRSVYQSKTIGQLKLQQVVLDRLDLSCGGEVGYSFVLKSDLTRLGVSPQDCDDLVDIVRSLEGPRIILFLKETRDGVFRGNLRSKFEGIDVSLVAGKFGGGGHKAAAGFTAEGSIENVLDRVLGECREVLVKMGDSGIEA